MQAPSFKLLKNVVLSLVDVTFKTQMESHSVKLQVVKGTITCHMTTQIYRQFLFLRDGHEI